jgi:hypothetical protein
MNPVVYVRDNRASPSCASPDPGSGNAARAGALFRDPADAPVFRTAVGRAAAMRSPVWLDSIPHLLNKN